MCNLEYSPWRANFTGELCRCGVPTPGTPEEREFDQKMLELKRKENEPTEEEKRQLIKQKRESIRAELESYKQQRIAALYFKYHGNIRDS